MRISDWSSDVCSSDRELRVGGGRGYCQALDCGAVVGLVVGESLATGEFGADPAQAVEELLRAADAGEGVDALAGEIGRPPARSTGLGARAQHWQAGWQVLGDGSVGPVADPHPGIGARDSAGGRL